MSHERLHKFKEEDTVPSIRHNVSDYKNCPCKAVEVVVSLPRGRSYELKTIIRHNVFPTA